MNNRIENEKQSIIEQINTIIAETEFQEKGFAFSSVRPKSAKELFGDNWKYVVSPYLDAEEIFEASEKDQLKPIDIMLASVYSDGDVKLKNGKQITLKVVAGDDSYNGTHKIIAINGRDIVIPAIKRGDAQGIYQNTEKLDQLALRKEKFEAKLNQLSDLISGKEEVKTEPVNEPVLADQGFKSKSKKIKIGWIESVLALVAISGLVIIFLPGKKETANIQMA